MLFHSPFFLFIFLPSVFCVYFLTNKLTKIDTKIILIISGLIFYSWWNIYLSPLIIVSICLNYFLSKLLINNEEFSSKKKISLHCYFFEYCFFNNLKIFRFYNA